MLPILSKIALTLSSLKLLADLLVFQLIVNSVTTFAGQQCS